MAFLLIGMELKHSHSLDTDYRSRLEIVGRPVELKASSALASVVPSGFLNVLDKIGFNPTTWF